jgi:glycosyltransferase involved in cell wall biosynthesis
LNNISIITATHYRAKQLSQYALPSILKQTDKAFEWIVINDGGDLATREIFTQLKSNIKISYEETLGVHDGFGLCHARNKGLSLASGDFVVYLDDDNELLPNFVEWFKFQVKKEPYVKVFIPQQLRRRNIVKAEKIVKLGKEFVSPSSNSTLSDLITQKELFDSNGFIHYRENAPIWNPKYKIFCDYEYFLQSLNIYEPDKFKICHDIEVIYTQTNEGIIGKSNYQDWAKEIIYLCDSSSYYRVLDEEVLKNLRKIAARWNNKYNQENNIEAFSLKEYL